MQDALTAGVEPGRYAGRSEAAGDALISAIFHADGRFQMSGGAGIGAAERQPAVGRYVVEDDVLVLSDVQGGAGGAAFPMICGLQPTATGFALARVEAANGEGPDAPQGAACALDGVSCARLD